ncbi:MAG: carboxyl-terminal processing protease [Saprospiraceae bacterium]|jgi:carboxyl-terminal processing protease
MSIEILKSFTTLATMNFNQKSKGFSPVLLLLIVVCFAACGMVLSKVSTTSKDTKTGDLIAKLVRNTHYNQLVINDEFSKNAFEALLDFSDPNKRFFIQKDIDALKKHELLVDNYFIKSDLTFFNDFFPLIEKREEKVEKLIFKILEKPIEFNELTNVQTDADSLSYCNSEKELKQRWRKNLAFMINDKLYYLEKKQANDTLQSDTVKVKKTLKEMEIQAREQVLKRHKEWFNRLSKLEKDDRLSNYFNALLSIYCPHTQYYPPKDKEDFDIGFTGKLEGIGATLSMREGYIKVEKIVAGSASWKAGDLKAGDLILEVAQGDEPPVDVYDMRLDKAVRLIRGPKGTEVRLTIKKVSGDIEVISIIRDLVVIEETYAKSLILKDTSSNDRFGYIHLASFYADFNNRNGRRCSKDVLKEIRALKKHKVKSIILDLRNNGGGSLTDAIEMAGYFIKAGPIVQVDGVGEAPKVYSDVNPLVQYDGGLIVMVNEFSASASEIFAAAIQDYKRGVIIGTNTYGKGTVQRFYPLTQVAKAYDVDIEGQQIGEVKETIAKFFRINGGATQLRGVAPDVLLPDAYMYLDMGEGSNEYALEWKAIPKADYKTFNYAYDIKELSKKSQARIDTVRYFKQVDQSAKILKKNREASLYPLSFKEYKKSKIEREEQAKDNKPEKQDIMDWEISFHSKDSSSFEKDTISLDRMEKFKESIKNDRYIREALKIGAEM